MQFQVPQFIETEDKIVGPFTLRQFLYVGGAGGLSFLLYFTVTTGIWVIFSIFIVGAGLALAFVKINGRPLVGVLLSAAHFYWQPQIYVWQPEHPSLPKNEATLGTFTQTGFSLENIIRGLALKNTWRKLQVGSKTTEVKQRIAKSQERYQVIERKTGERQNVRRVDYR